MDIRDSRAAELYYDMQHRLTPYVQRLGLGPNRISLLGLGLAILVPFGFWLAAIVGVLFMALSAIADGLDGYLATQERGKTHFGAFLDSTLDRGADFLYLAGFWVYSVRVSPEGLWLTAFILLAILGSLLISYTKARLEGLGVVCSVGLMDRPVRTIYLLAWALILALVPAVPVVLLWLGLIPYLVLVYYTVGQRIRLAARVLDQEEESV